MKKVHLTTLFIFFLMLFVSYGCAKAFRYSIGCASIAADQKFSFFIISDIHYLSKKLYDNGKAFENFLTSGDGKLLHYSDEVTDVLLQDIKDKAPDFLVLTGDLTCNGERESHLEIVKKLEEVEKMGTCVFVLPGNHDLENPWAKNYIGDDETGTETITKDEFLKLYAPFGYEEAVSRDPDSLSYIAMPAKDTWLLMLDSSDYKMNMKRQYPVQAGYLRPETLKWVEQCANLAKENGARLIAVMHHNLIDHSKQVNEDYTLDNNEEALKVFRKCGIEIVLTGHIHLQDIKTDMNEGQAIYDIATGSLSVYPNQYGIMDFVPHKGFDYHTSLLDMNSWAAKQGITDTALLNFKEYSADIFIDQCCKRHREFLLTFNELSEGDKEKVYKVLVDMNMMYFAGYRNDAFDEIAKTEGYKILEKMPSCLTTEHFLSMIDDERTDNNTIHIPVATDEE